MNKAPEINDGFSVFAASDNNAILSRMCSSLTCKYIGIVENNKGETGKPKS